MIKYFAIGKKVTAFLLPVLVLNFLFINCSGSKKNAGKNVILITLDTQRSDFLSTYTAGKAETHNIDKLAAQGMLFTQAYSLIPITLPAHAAIFYSLPPHRLQLYNNGQLFKPDKGLISLAEIFNRKGFSTAAFISLGVLQAKFGLQQGFSQYFDSLPPQRWYLNAEEVNHNVYKWLDTHRQEKFFIWLHYSDPHEPYSYPEQEADLSFFLNGQKIKDVCVQSLEHISIKFELQSGLNTIRLKVLNPFPRPWNETRISLNDFHFFSSESLSFEFVNITLLDRDGARILALRDEGLIHINNPGKTKEVEFNAKGNINLFPSERIAAYRRETEYLDQKIGELIDRLTALGLYSKSIIFLVGDHGEGLGEYQTGQGEYYFGHIHYLHNIYLKIPFIIHDPTAVERHLRISTPVSILDVAPTILGLMDWERPNFYQGRDLNKPGLNKSYPVFTETYLPEAIQDRFAAFSFPWHLIFTPELQRFELYDLNKDPEEKHDVFSINRDRPEIIKLTREIQNKSREILKNKKEVKLDKNSEEMLRSLGYIK